MNTVGILSIILSLIMAAYVTYESRSRRMPILMTLAKQTRSNLQLKLLQDGNYSEISYQIFYNHIPFQPHHIVLKISNEGPASTTNPPGPAKYCVVKSPLSKEICLSIQIPNDQRYHTIINEFLKAGWL